MRILFGLIYSILLINTSFAFIYPDPDWPISRPEYKGLDPEKINKVLSIIRNGPYPIHSLLIVYKGFLVLEYYSQPYQVSSLHPIYSCTKSVLSALTGITLHEGLIKDIDQSIFEYFTDKKEYFEHPMKKIISIRNLLTMTSGLEWHRNLNSFNFSNYNRLNFVLSLLCAETPGTRFNYNNDSTHILSTIIHRVSINDNLDFAYQKLFYPIGVSNIIWIKDSQGITMGDSGIYMMSRDMAKFGYLYLRKGKWKNNQIIPEQWIKGSSARQVDGYPYGFLFWINSFGGYRAQGRSGQYIFILPQSDMVVVFTAGMKDRDLMVPVDLVSLYILPSIK